MISGHPGSGPRSPRFAAWGCGTVLAGCLLLVGCQAPGGGPTPAEPAPPARVTGTVGTGRPVSIQIPAIGVDAPVVPVGLGPGRTMAVPAVDLAGWYEPGARPGEAGPAVIVGHVDSRRGLAVFYRLRQLHPVERIWNDTRRPVLRLITCGAASTAPPATTGDNVIVYANRAAS